MNPSAAGLAGTWFVVPTPLHANGSVDLESQRRLVDAAIAWGVDGLTAMGVTSEASLLTDDERSAALDAISFSTQGRVPVVIGCSGRTVDEVVPRLDDARRRGAAAAMVAAPPGTENPTSLPPFFAACRDRGGLPLVIQDEPAATGVSMPVEILRECMHAADATTIKLEAPPTAPKIASLVGADGRLQVFGGLGGAYALSELRAGASGTMTGFAFPEVMAAIRRMAEKGDWSRAAAVYDRYLPLIQFEAQPIVGLAVRKEILRRRGVLATARCRREPIVLDDVTMSELDDVLRRVGIDAGPSPLQIVDATA